MLTLRISRDEEFTLGVLTVVQFIFFSDETIICAAEPANPDEAVKWLYKSAMAGHVRAQYQLALCLHQGRGMNHNIQEAVCSLVSIHSSMPVSI